MRRCNFCGRWFKNKQAVRAHLKYCTVYLEQKGSTIVDIPVHIPKSIRKSTPAKNGALAKTKLDLNKIRRKYASKKEYA